MSRPERTHGASLVALADLVADLVENTRNDAARCEFAAQAVDLFVELGLEEAPGSGAVMARLDLLLLSAESRRL